MTKYIFTALLVVCVALTAIFAFGKPGLRPSVQSEPLACVQLGAKLVCLDGDVSAALSCTELKGDTVLCQGQ